MSKALPVRIVRCDGRNFAVEVYKELTNPKTKTVRWDWVETDYYGHRLEHAAANALLAACPVGSVVTPELVRSAVEEIVARTNDALGAKEGRL